MQSYRKKLGVFFLLTSCSVKAPNYFELNSYFLLFSSHFSHLCKAVNLHSDISRKRRPSNEIQAVLIRILKYLIRFGRFIKDLTACKQTHWYFHVWSGVKLVRHLPRCSQGFGWHGYLLEYITGCWGLFSELDTDFACNFSMKTSRKIITTRHDHLSLMTVVNWKEVMTNNVK